MNAEQLNVLAVEAKNNEVKVWEIKAHYMNLIEQLAQKNWYKMNNETRFIDDCYRRIDYAIRSFDENRGRFGLLVQMLLDQAVREHCGNRGKLRNVLCRFEDESNTDADSDDSEADPALIDKEINIEEDVLADMSLQITLDELSGGCEKKRFVLSELSEGNGNKSDIARKLSHTYGTKENSERIFVRRFMEKLERGA